MRRSRGLVLLRYGLPLVVVLAGVVVMSLGSESEIEGGAGIAGAGLAIFAMNWLIRASTEGDREREREEAARDYFDAHGRWPDEAAAVADASSPAAPAAPAPDAAATLQRRFERAGRERERGTRRR
jgi:hypothetical protein